MEATQTHDHREGLLAALGGLLTMPENGQPTALLALGVHAAAGLAATGVGEVTPASTADHLSAQRAEPPEPMPNPFCDLLVTARGHAVARCAFADDSVRDAELLIASVLAAERGECTRMLSCLDAGLALMSELAERCDWQLYEAPGGTPGKVEIPGAEELARLSQRVLFDAGDLSRICGSEWEQTLAPLILRDRVEAGGTELESQPLVPRSRLRPRADPGGGRPRGAARPRLPPAGDEPRVQQPGRTGSAPLRLRTEDRE